MLRSELCAHLNSRVWVLLDVPKSSSTRWSYTHACMYGTVPVTRLPICTCAQTLVRRVVVSCIVLCVLCSTSIYYTVWCICVRCQHRELNFVHTIHPIYNIYHVHHTLRHTSSCRRAFRTGAFPLPLTPADHAEKERVRDWSITIRLSERWPCWWAGTTVVCMWAWTLRKADHVRLHSSRQRRRGGRQPSPRRHHPWQQRMPSQPQRLSHNCRRTSYKLWNYTSAHTSCGLIHFRSMSIYMATTSPHPWYYKIHITLSFIRGNRFRVVFKYMCVCFSAMFMHVWRNGAIVSTYT